MLQGQQGPKTSNSQMLAHLKWPLGLRWVTLHFQLKINVKNHDIFIKIQKRKHASLPLPWLHPSLRSYFPRGSHTWRGDQTWGSPLWSEPDDRGQCSHPARGLAVVWVTQNYTVPTAGPRPRLYKVTITGWFPHVLNRYHWCWSKNKILQK